MPDDIAVFAKRIAVSSKLDRPARRLYNKKADSDKQADPAGELPADVPEPDADITHRERMNYGLQTLRLS